MLTFPFLDWFLSACKVCCALWLLFVFLHNFYNVCHLAAISHSNKIPEPAGYVECVESSQIVYYQSLKHIIQNRWNTVQENHTAQNQRLFQTMLCQNTDKLTYSCIWPKIPPHFCHQYQQHAFSHVLPSIRCETHDNSLSKRSLFSGSVGWIISLESNIFSYVLLDLFSCRI